MTICQRIARRGAEQYAMQIRAKISFSQFSWRNYIKTPLQLICFYQTVKGILLG